MSSPERYVSPAAKRVLRSLYRTYRESADAGTIYCKVAAIQQELRLPWEQIEETKVQLAKHRLVSYPPSDVDRDRQDQIIALTSKGIEAAARLKRRKWKVVRWALGKIVTIIIASLLAAIAAAWLLANHGDCFKWP